MSSTGQIVGGIVGAVVGFFTPVGPVMGAQIGMTIGGVIDPPDGPVINGPRLDDLSVQTSTYGAFIPRNYGTIAQTGNIFWLKGDALTETPRAEESGGKGGTTSTTNLWDYSATFALGLCDCSDGVPIDGIRRIWIAGQLFYDAGSNDVETIIASNDASEIFTLYNGSDTQLPSPLMQADKGAANVPAYRGLAYIVFENLPLAKYNNSLVGAQIKVEIIKNGAVADDITILSSVASDLSPIAARVSGRYIYVAYQQSVDMDVYELSDLGVPTLISSLPMGYYSDGLSIFGNYAYVFNATGGFKIVDISIPFSPSIIGNLAIYGNPRFYMFDVVGDFAYGAGFASSALHVYDVRDKTSPYLISTTTVTGVPSAIDIDGYFAYLVSSGTGAALQIYNITSPSAPAFVSTTTATPASYTCVKYRDGYVFCGNLSYGGIEIYDVSDPLLPVLVGSTTTGGSVYDIVFDNDYLYVANLAGSVAVVDISDLTAPALLATENVGGNVLSVDTDGDMIYVPDRSNHLIKTYLLSRTASSNTTYLSTIVESECLSSKLLTSADLDVTELTDVVRGYRVASLGALRGGLDPLRAAWPFDVVQHGYQILFKRRGSASVATIDASELDARSAGEAPGVQITNSREMDTLLPSSLRLKYLDSVREYDTNEQISDRGL